MFLLLLLLRLIIISALVRLLLQTGKPFWCAGTYTVLRIGLWVMLGAALQYVVVGAAIVLALACLYFWLLDRYEGTGAL